MGSMAHAQQRATHLRTAVWRTITVPIAGPLAEDVPELRVAPGSATLVKFPQPIVPRDGFKVFGGEGRIEAQQAGPSTIVLVSTYEIGPERIPLAVATIDGRRYPFLLVTRPNLVDIEVRVAIAEEAQAEAREDAIIDGLVRREKVFARQYERPLPVQPRERIQADWETPHVSYAVRMGRLYFIQVTKWASQPWKVDQAKMEGSGGEILKVRDIHWEMQRERDGVTTNTNVIVAEVPERAGADYVLTSIELVGGDARVATLDQQVSLP
jgi:hypothetical protein